MRVEHDGDHGSKRLRVAHVVHALDVGGLERVVLSLVSQGQRLGQEPAIVCLERLGALATQAAALGVSVDCVEKHPGLSLSTTLRLRDVFRRMKPDVVHTHQIAALFYGGPAARWAGRATVVHTEHGRHDYSGRTRWMARCAGSFASRWFCVSRDIASSVIDRKVVAAQKVHIVPNGIDTRDLPEVCERTALRASLGIPFDAPVIGTVGRLTEIKRQDLLLSAVAQLKFTPPPHLLLVGDGPLRCELEKHAKALGIESRVHFAGYQASPMEFLQLMDVFALTSRSEGMPLAILEAWAAGVPVVASRVGGIPDLVEEGRTGIMFESGDAPELLSCLEQLLANRSQAKQMGAAGRALLQERFDVSIMADTYNQQYLQLLSQRGPTGWVAPKNDLRLAVPDAVASAS